MIEAEAADEGDRLRPEGAGIVRAQLSARKKDAVAVPPVQRMGDGNGIGDDEEFPVLLQRDRNEGGR